MKKLLWFTKDQIMHLEYIKSKTGNNNNSEIVREAMKLYVEKLMLEK